MRIAKQFWIVEPGRAEIFSKDLVPRLDTEVLVAAAFGAVSRGTESLVFRGEVPVSQYEIMKAPFQDGQFPGPVKYGYSSVGEVVEGPAELVGRMVFCLYPHQDVYCVPAGSVTLLPTGVPPERAILAANMETAVNVVWDAGLSVGDTVVVIGAGVIGLLAATLCRNIPGVRVDVVDPNESRKDVCTTLGMNYHREVPKGLVADAVLHVSGSPEGLRAALAVAGLEATIVEASWYGTRNVSLPLGEFFHARRLTLRSSQVGRLPMNRLPRWTHRKRLELALELLRDSCFDVLINSESSFDDLPDVLPQLSHDPGSVLCHRVRYGS